MAIQNRTVLSSTTMVSLAPFDIPLEDTLLIEASAGTGKTYTISLLYLRLLLGLRHCGQITTPLSVEQILVVTFTKSATEELRSRIRSNINELRIHCIRHQSSKELTLHSRFLTILERLESANFLNQAIDLLLLAEQQMDNASIFTIHGFAQRILNELALESNNLFKLNLLENETNLLEQVSYDFWRRLMYGRDLMFQHAILNCFDSPQNLVSYISDCLKGKLPDFKDEIGEDLSKKFISSDTLLKLPRLEQRLTLIIETYERDRELVIEVSNRIKKGWAEAIKDKSSVLAQLIGDLSSLNANSYKPAKVEEAVMAINHWCNTSQHHELPPKSIAYFSQKKLSACTKKNKIEPKMELFVHVDDYLSNDLSHELKVNILKLAIIELRLNIVQRKFEDGIVTFDDLINRIDEAIDVDTDESLRTAIQTQYPVALIDEFQDTDRAQYSVFSALYNKSYQENHSPLLILIGDPKQAIYAFRGADIFTYMHAKKETPTHYTLDTNYRSAPQVVTAVNQLFSISPCAFLFEDIPFLPVKYSPKNSELAFVVNNKVQPGIGIIETEQEDASTVGMYREEIAEKTARLIAKWLECAKNQEALFINDKNEKINLSVDDICILVRSKNHADLIKEALNNYGIPSIYLSGETSVFSTDIATDLLRFLNAVNQPSDERLLTESLGSTLFQLSADDLYQLRENEELLEQQLSQFSEYKLQWQQYGILSLLRTLLFDHQLASKWQAAGMGERVLMDFLHLSELLQANEIKFQSPVELIAWLSEQILQTTMAKDDIQLRLESNKNLVKIMTIHKSKGLEFPIVLYPFALTKTKANKALTYVDEATLTKVIDFESDKQRDILSKKMQLAEDIRLTYVALTRAKYHCIIGMTNFAKPEDYNLGYLLDTGDSKNIESNSKGNHLPPLMESVKSLVSSNNSEILPNGAIGIEFVDSALFDSVTVLDNQEKNEASFLKKEFKRTIADIWRVTSYSYLSMPKYKTKNSVFKPEFYEKYKALLSETSENIKRSGVQEKLLSEHGVDHFANSERKHASKVGDESDLPSGFNAFNFPRGVQAGIFLHSLLEETERYLGTDEASQSALKGSLSSLVVNLSNNQINDENIIQWQSFLTQWLNDILNVPLLNANCCLSKIPPSRQIKEMHFHLSMPNQVSAEMLNQVLCHHDPLSAKAGSLTFEKVKGMIQGFIDLVFMHEGQYYIVDYKSNHLGESLADYSHESMADAMLAHRYDLQYQIYTLALHRYLKMRISDYDYETHFGGVYYLFIRALDSNMYENSSSLFAEQNMSKKEQPGIFYVKPTREFVEAFDLLLG